MPHHSWALLVSAGDTGYLVRVINPFRLYCCWNLLVRWRTAAWNITLRRAISGALHRTGVQNNRKIFSMLEAWNVAYPRTRTVIFDAFSLPSTTIFCLLFSRSPSLFSSSLFAPPGRHYLLEGTDADLLRHTACILFPHQHHQNSGDLFHWAQDGASAAVRSAIVRFRDLLAPFVSRVFSTTHLSFTATALPFHFVRFHCILPLRRLLYTVFSYCCHCTRVFLPYRRYSAVAFRPLMRDAVRF